MLKHPAEKLCFDDEVQTYDDSQQPDLDKDILSHLSPPLVAVKDQSIFLLGPYILLQPPVLQLLVH